MVPISYTLRSLFVRRSATLLTVFGIGATVAVVAGVLALQQGFQTLFSESGREDVAVFLRVGANAEGESTIPREQAQIIIKGTPEISIDEQGRPMAALEAFMAVLLERTAGGDTNVPVRGVQPMSYAIHGDGVRLVEGEWPEPGSNEIAVGSKLVGRVDNCRIGDVIQINLTPLTVVGVFESDGPYDSEIWGDTEVILEALERPEGSRVVARVEPGTDFEALAARVDEDPQLTNKVLSEREYLSNQTQALTGILLALGSFLGLVMGAAAVFTATNTMLSAVAARTHEIGILLSIGYRPFPIFLSFIAEALVLGLLGGLTGCLLVLPVNGMETGTTNFNTFTEVAFAFRVTPFVLVTAVSFSLVLGLLGGAWPAWRAASMRPTEALRRR